MHMMLNLNIRLRQSNLLNASLQLSFTVPNIEPAAQLQYLGSPHKHAYLATASGHLYFA